MTDTPLFPKPSQIKQKPVAVRVMKSGAEKCNLLVTEGRHEYMRRKREMWERQGRMCCLYGFLKSCPGRLNWADAVFEHQDGRGMNGSIRDDRIERPDPKTGKMKPFNGAAHSRCNLLKSSRRIDYTGFYGKR